MASGGEHAGISVICDADGVVVLQTARAALNDDARPAIAEAWTSDDGRATEVGTPLVKTFWFDHLDCDHKELQQIVRRAAAGKSDRVRVWVRVNKDQLIRAELTALPLFDSSGGSRQVLIRTEPTRADPKRRDPEALQKAMRTIDDATALPPTKTFAEVDLLSLRLAVPLVRIEIATGTVLAANEAFADLIGRPRGECANLPLSEFLHADDRRAASEAFAGRPFSNAAERSVDVRLIAKGGDIPTRLTRTADPAIDGAAILVVIDRSDERRAVSLEAANAELAAASAHRARWLTRLDKLIDHAPVGMALFENGQPIRTNPAFERQSADSGGWVDALAHRAAKSKAVAEQLSTRQAITGYWLGEESDSSAALVGTTIVPTPLPALDAERHLDAALKAMRQSERVAAAIFEPGGNVITLGASLSTVLSEAVPGTIDELVAEESLSELRSTLAQVRSSRSTISTRIALRQHGRVGVTLDVTLAPCEGGQDVLALFEDTTELSNQVESLRSRLALQHEAIERLEVAAAEAGEARQLRARDVEREAQSKRLFDAFSGGALSWNVDEGRVEADARARALLRCDASAELTPATLLAAATADDRGQFERALFDAMSPEGDGSLDAIVHCGPEASPVRIVGNVLFDERDGSRDPSRFVGGAVDVSESRRAEGRVTELAAMLQLRTAELNAIFECSPDAVRITTNGTMRHNAAAASLFADHIDAMFNGDGTAPPAMALAGRAAAAIISVDGDGNGKLVMSSAAPVVSGGQIVGAVSVDRDVTDQRHLEEQLRHRDEQIAGLFQNTGVGLAYLDAHGGMLDTNPQLSVLLGHSRSDLVGRPLGELVFDADRATLSGQLEAVLSGELTSCSSEVRLLRRGGEPCWVQLTIAPRHGTGDRSVVAIVQDVNDLRIERERNAEASVALSSARERFDLLASTVGEGFVILDSSLRLVEANPAARRLLSLPTTADGVEFEHLSFASPETGTAITSRLPWQRAARGKATTAELVVRRLADGAEGTPRTLEFVASPAAERQVVINVRDVTSRHAMQEDLQKAYARVVEAHTLLQQRTQQWEGNFVSAVHQLGAATSSVAPVARAIAGDSRLPADLRAAAQRLVDSFRVHERLVKHYADLPGGGTSGANRGAERPAPTTREDVDVQALADQALKLVSARFNVAGRLTTKLAATDVVCHVDAALVRHALWSVFSHAAGHASRAAARVETSDVRLPKGDRRLRIAVTWTGRQARAAELALAMSLVESEGGTFTIDQVGEGTVATIEFEVVNVTLRSKPPSTSIRAQVLLIEDHDSTARVLSRQLARLQCAVTLAKNLAEAESVLTRPDAGTKIDLIVCDLTMPDGSAAEFVTRVNAARTAAKKAALPAIALRGYGGDHDTKALKAAGFVDQLIKPVDLSALASAIGKMSSPRGGASFAQDVIE